MKETIKRLANQFGYRITRTDNQHFFNFESLIYFYLAEYKSIKFVQVGGCDGVSFDPLYPLIKSRPENFEGIIVEPIKQYFENLKNLYRDNKKIKPVRYAIHNSLDEAVLYKADPEMLSYLPDYTKGVVSFDRLHLEKFNIPVENIIEEKVPCKTLDGVMKEYEIENPDLLLTDTEGYDAEILLNFNFDKNRPAIIHFEHGIRENLISSKHLDRIFEKLHHYKYELIFEDFDAVAIHRELLLRITK